MKFSSLFVAILLVAFAGTSVGQPLKQRKPGLWEIQYAGEDSRSRIEQEKMAERMKSMTPEKRAQMEAYIKEHGVGMRAGPGGMPMMTMRVCLTPEEIADESGQTLMQSLKQESTCTRKVLNQSATELHMTAHCSAQGGGSFNDMDVRIFNVTPTQYSVDMKGNGPRGEMHMQQQARWLGADCKGAF